MNTIKQQLAPDSIPKTMKDILASTEFTLPKPFEVLEGEIISVSKNSVLIDLGVLGTGIVYPGEFYENPNVQKALKPGQKVFSVLLDLEDEDGYRELSLRRAQTNTAWQEIKEKRDSGEIITTKIININKGGLIIEINGVQGFLPLSQLSTEHYPKVEGGDTAKIVQALQKLRNEEIKIKIIDFSEEENRLIVSERAIYADQLRDEMSKFKVGDVVEGTITDVTDFGAFVKLNDTVEGLVHISEIDWRLIENPRDILKTGDNITAKVISTEGNKISLSLKALKDDPWLGIEEKFKVGQKVRGSVAKITSHGAMVNLSDNIIGLVPSSELGGNRDFLKLGEEYTFAIVSLEPQNHKMILTLEKETDEKETQNQESSAAALS